MNNTSLLLNHSLWRGKKVYMPSRFYIYPIVYMRERDGYISIASVLSWLEGNEVMARVWISKHVPSNAMRLYSQHYHWLAGTGTTISFTRKIDRRFQRFVRDKAILSTVSCGLVYRGREAVVCRMGVQCYRSSHFVAKDVRSERI